MYLTFATATEDDADDVAALRSAVALDLTRRFGQGHWSAVAAQRAVVRDIRTAVVLAVRDPRRLVATVRLSAKRPWAIDPAFFTATDRVLYLTDMAVQPELQGRGIGRRALEYATAVALAWPAGAIRLDAYDGPAGAGPFYERCGYREVGRVTYRKTPLIYYERLLSPRG